MSRHIADLDVRSLPLCHWLPASLHICGGQYPSTVTDMACTPSVQVGQDLDVKGPIKKFEVGRLFLVSLNATAAAVALAPSRAHEQVFQAMIPRLGSVLCSAVQAQHEEEYRSHCGWLRSDTNDAGKSHGPSSAAHSGARLLLTSREARRCLSCDAGGQPDPVQPGGQNTGQCGGVWACCTAISTVERCRLPCPLLHRCKRRYRYHADAFQVSLVFANQSEVIFVALAPEHWRCSNGVARRDFPLCMYCSL